MNSRSTFGDIISGLFGIVVMAIGMINMFWGNDPGYGIFIFLLAFVYLPPALLFKENFYHINSLKIILGIFIF